MSRCAPASSALVDFVVSNNATFGDALQFDPPVPGVTGPAWSFSNQNFRLDIKPNLETASPLLSLLSSAGQIVVDDVTLRILHFNVPESVISAALIPGEYIYDFIMFDGSTPPVRVQIAHGKFIVTDGITGG
jgi:hypothetical protein